MKKISAIVLAGGKSKRFGSNKRDIVINGQTLLEGAVRKLRKISQDIVIVLSPNETLSNFQEFVVYDEVEGEGPLMGIYTGLKSTKNEKSMVMPVDTPFVSVEFLEYLVELSNNYDAVLPLWNEGLEPLIGVYNKSIISDLESWKESGNKMAPHLFLDSLSKQRINFINESDIKKFGNSEKLFFNINTPEDLKKAQSLI